MGIKNLVSKALFLVNPYWDEIGWNRQHDSRMRAAGLTPRKRKSVMSFAPRTTHVLIVPQNGPSGDNFFAGQWNIYYEATKALEDLIGAENVTVFDVPAGEQPAVWQQRLVDQVT